MNTIAVIAVRMGSTRLPGKALREVAGKPLLGHLLDRLALSRQLDGIVVATSLRSEDDSIESYCRSRATSYFRGDEHDLLARALGALQSQNATIGVQVFGDGPLIDPAIVDRMIVEYRDAAAAYDFVGNDLATTWPPGMEVEVFSVAAFGDSHRRCADKELREHSTLFMRQNPALYRLKNVEAPPEFHRPDLELEVDTVEDLTVIGAVLEHFAGRPSFGLGDIIRFVDGNSELTAINRDVPRRWKEFRVDARQKA